MNTKTDKNIKRDVFICDDDKEICEILQEYCINMGCFKNIVLAYDGITATMKLRNQKFAVILLDINMPKKTGFDLIGEFNPGSLNHKENIIVVSGTLDRELIAKIITKGVKSFIVKPFTEAQFQEKILKILAGTK
jgi:response regulator of citrate/malate metabolism